MRIAIGSDHAGFSLKGTLVEVLRDGGHEVVDVGTDSDAVVDYPDYAEAVAVAVRRGEVDRGVMICGSGVGASVAANKVPGVRAAICHDTYSAHQGVEHDDMNILVLGGRVVGGALAVEVLEACNWNKAEVGRQVGLSRTAIWKYMKKWDIPLKPPGNGN